MFVVDHYVKAASKVHIEAILENSQYRSVFRHHGGAILSNKVFTSPEIPEAIVSFVKSSMEYMLEYRKGEKRQKTKDMLQYRYKLDICSAMQALDRETMKGYLTGLGTPAVLYLWTMYDLKLPLAAAVGDIGMLKDMLTLPQLLPPHCELFPTAMEAAVGANQMESLNVILEWVATNIKGKRETGSWDQMRSAAPIIVRALQVAVRLHKTNAGSMMLEFLSNNLDIKNSMGPSFGKFLVKDCMRSGNTPLLHIAFSMYKTNTFTPWNSVKPKMWDLWSSDLENIFKIGHKRVMRVYLQTGQLHPNHFSCKFSDLHANEDPLLETKTPLVFAIEKRRYDLARTLLEEGADINGFCNDGLGTTALYQATCRSYYKDVQFLLSMGADPDFTKTPRLSPLRNAKTMSSCKTSFLLETVAKEGKQAVIGAGIWSRYQDQMDDKFWFW
jgi:hypothetical protein